MSLNYRLNCILFLCIFILSCQDENSSGSEFRTDEKTYLDSLIDLSLDSIYADNFESADSVLMMSELIASQLEDTASLAKVYNNTGLLNYHLSNYSTSINYYGKALILNRFLGDSSKVGDNLKNLGISYYKRGSYETALKYYQEALDIKIQIKDTLGQASIYNSIGNTLNELKRFKESYEYFKQAQEIWINEDDTLRQSYAFGNLGISLLGQGKVEEAIKNHLASLAIKKSLGLESKVSTTLTNLGEAHVELGDFLVAQDYFLESLEIRERFKNEKGVALVCNNLAEVSLLLKLPAKAIYWLRKAELIARDSDYQDIFLESTRLWGVYYAEVGNHKKAYETSLLYDELKERNFNEQVVGVKDLIYDYDINQEEQAKITAQNERDLFASREAEQRLRANIQLIVIIAAVLAIAFIGLFAYRLRKKNQHIENLIRELHHRVKNHLGMISGMFGAQSDGLPGADAAFLDEAKTRIEAVNGIHRRLYREDEYEYVNMLEYLTELVDNNALVFGLFNRIDKEIDIKHELLDIDKAISVGLIANEVLTNAFKYGLQDTQAPALKVVLEKMVKGYRMVIYNNGSTDKDTSSGTGFGSELIKRLVQNLKGTAEIKQENGFQFELSFP